MVRFFCDQQIQQPKSNRKSLCVYFQLLKPNTVTHRLINAIDALVWRCLRNWNAIQALAIWKVQCARMNMKRCAIVLNRKNLIIAQELVMMCVHPKNSSMIASVRPRQWIHHCIQSVQQTIDEIYFYIFRIHVGKKILTINRQNEEIFNWKSIRRTHFMFIHDTSVWTDAHLFWELS